MAPSASVLIACVYCAGAVAWLPAASLTPVVLTSTVMLPWTSAAGMTTSL